jgi:tetratricopeptide (TPR) repeat protein
MALNRISLCMIVRDEAEMISECLRSASGAADEIIVVDTGSCDDTPRIAAAMGARMVHHEWRDDFSEARNASIALASGDWVLWMDADERLREEEFPRIRAAVNEPNIAAFLVPILNRTADGAHVSRGHRLFRTRCGISFSGRIHEQISPSLTGAMGRVAPAPFTIDHLGYALAEEKLRRKNERNLALLREAKAADPRDAYTRFTLAQALMIRKEFDAAEHEVRVALGRVPEERIARPLPPDLRAAGLNNLADCAVRRGDPKGALSHCRESLRVVPQQTTAHLIAYRAWTLLEDSAAALGELESVARMLEGAGAAGRSAIEITLDAGDLRHAMGQCCLRLDRAEQARRHFLKALDRDPNRPQTLAGLARCALAEDDLDEAARRADEALVLAPEEDALLDLSSFVLLKAGRFEAAAERMGRLCVRHPEDGALRKRLAGVLVKMGRKSDAIALLAPQNVESEKLTKDPKVPIPSLDPCGVSKAVRSR